MALPKPPPEEQFGPYEVYERLGVGGMATVHRAKERGIEGFERVVALKRLLPHLAEDGTFVKAFVREAKLASMLQHVNIVQIFELGRVGSQYFISMEHIEGRDLRQVLRHARRVTGPPPIHITVGILMQLCDALDYAHAKCDENGNPLRIVHRDVSPSNLLITNTGHLKVIDFGIAKAQSIHAQTQTGRVKGKLAYMAPEAIGGKDLDCRSDLFAAGVIAHELLTARPLFASKNEYQTILKVQRGDILPPSTFNQACPPELDAIVLRALARNQDDRFASAGELREELAALRVQYQYASGSREIATWIEWAFSVEAPSGSFSAAGTDTPFTGTLGNTLSALARSGSASGDHTTPEASLRAAMVRARPPSKPGAGRQTGPFALPGVEALPQRPEFLPATFPVSDDDGGRARSSIEPQADEDEAAVMAWGSGEAANGRAIPEDFDDVPDVSVKNPAAGVRVIDRLDDAAEPGTEEQDTQHDGMAPSATKPGMAVVSANGVMVAPAPAREPAPVAADAAVTAVPMQIGPRSTSGPMLSPSQPSSASASIEIEPSPSEAWFTNTAFGASGSFSATDISKSSGTFGAAMVERNQKSRNGKRVVAALALCAAVGGGAWWITQRNSSPSNATTTASSSNSHLKFVVEPADAEIRIVGQAPHTGSPYQVDLAPGTYQVEIHRDGFKTYLTSVEMTQSEKQSLRVVLEAAGAGAAASDSTLVITSTPNGADIELDGTPTQLHTPAKLEVKPGPHVIVLRQNGVEKWRQEFVAESNSNAEFGAVLSDERVRERAQRRSTWIAPSGLDPRNTLGSGTATPVISNKPDAASNGSAGSAAPGSLVPANGSGSAVALLPTTGTGTLTTGSGTPTTGTGTGTPTTGTVGTPTTGSGSGTPTTSSGSGTPTTGTATPATGTVGTPTVIKPTVPTPAVVTNPVPASQPPLLRPNSLPRISGEMPTFSSASSEDLPSTVSSKVCVDSSGKVTAIDVLSKLEGDARKAIEVAMRTWRYTPYRDKNVAQAACFIVTFRLK